MRPTVNSWLQGIREITSTARYPLGYCREEAGGKKYRYSRAGATALNAGYLGIAAAIAAVHADEAITAAISAGTKVLSLTVTAGTAILENELRGGQLTITYGTGKGHAYDIDGNSAISATDTSIIVSLEDYDSIKVALDTTSKFSLVHSPFNDVVETTTVGCPVGIAPCAVTAAYYYWAQTGGLCGAFCYETTGVGYAVEQSAETAGYVNTIDSDATEACQIGIIHGSAGVNGYFRPIWLTLD